MFVDDEAPIRELLSLFFKKKGMSVTTAQTSQEAREIAAKNVFDLAILDVNLAGEDGLALLNFFKAKHPQVPVVVFTGMAGDPDLFNRAMAGGAAGFMSKTEPLDRLLAEVQRHLQA